MSATPSKSSTDSPAGTEAMSSEPKAAPNSPALTERRRFRFALPCHLFDVLAALALALSFLTIPPAPRSTDLDPSLGAVLSHAHEHGLQFGTEMVSTYGPLGFLVFFYFSPHAAFVRMGVDVALCVTVATSIWLVARSLSLLSRISLLLVFAWGAANIQPRTDLILDTGLFCWALLCFNESGRRLRVYLSALVLFAAFCGLAKSYFIFTGLFLLLLVACDLWVRGKRAVAIATPLGFVGTVLIGWTLSGQNLSHFGTWLGSACTVIEGYTQAMGWEGSPRITRVGLVMLSVVVLTVLLRALFAFRARHQCGLVRPALFLTAITLMTAASWRHAFVRADALHAVLFLAFVPVLVFGQELLPVGAGHSSAATRGMAMASSLLAASALQIVFLPEASRSITQPFRNIAYHLKCLSAPAEYHQRMSELLERTRQEVQLPKLRQIVGAASVDVFGDRQSEALLNDLNYKPRPVFQSYGACNTRLMQMNEQFYGSGGAPEYVLFELAPLDRRFPPLEDARTFRDLLINYDFVAEEGRFLLLRRNSVEKPRLRLVAEGSVEAGKPLDLRAFNQTNLWLEITLKPTLMGKIRHWLFQPSVVRLAAWRESGKGLIRRQRAPASMLAAGFLASPLLLENRDLVNLCAGEPAVRPGAYTIELEAGSARFWQSEIHYRVCHLENEIAKRRQPGERLSPFIFFDSPGGARTGRPRAVLASRSH